jgi:transposase
VSGLSYGAAHPASEYCNYCRIPALHQGARTTAAAVIGAVTGTSRPAGSSRSRPGSAGRRRGSYGHPARPAAPAITGHRPPGRPGTAARPAPPPVRAAPFGSGAIAEYLRLRRHRLRVATPYSSQTKALRTVVRTRTDLVDARVAATNQLAALLDAHWPGGKAIFADLESPIALAFLTRYPTAAAAAGIGEKHIASFCAKQGYSGRKPAAVLLDRLRSAPAGTSDQTLTRAVADAVLAMIAVLTALNTAIKALAVSTAARLDEHPDAEIFTSLPRSGQINAAQILAEWGDCRQAYDGPDSVAALAGCTPVTKASGKHHAVHFRWACSKRFRVAVTTFAGNSRHDSPWATKIYNDARKAGKDHPHAVRILARAWIRVIWRCWLGQTPYDPAKHNAAAALNQPIAA